jgi:hypothetical protein
MKKKRIFGAILTLSILLVAIVATVIPTLAASTSNNSSVKEYVNGGIVTLQLPPAPDAAPPADPRTPSHPVDLVLAAFDIDKRSTHGAYDVLQISLWIPDTNSYVPVAVINDQTDIDGEEFLKELWGNTPVWMNLPFPPPDFQNIISVADTDLEVSRERSWTYRGFGGDHDSSNTFKVTLTQPVTIHIPFNLLPAPYSAWGNQTFTLPPLTLTFHEIGDKFKFEETNSALVPFSGYTVKMSGNRVPSWVQVNIPAWVGVLEVTGHTGTALFTYIPPT